VAETVLPRLAERAERQLERIINDSTQNLANSLATFEQKTALVSWRMESMWKDGIIDEFSAIQTRDLLDLLALNIHDPAWSQSLQRSFLSAFCKHQPQYLPEACLVVSGSNRTALGILGFHCEITEVVIPD